MLLIRNSTLCHLSALTLLDCSEYTSLPGQFSICYRVVLGHYLLIVGNTGIGWDLVRNYPKVSNYLLIDSSIYRVY